MLFRGSKCINNMRNENNLKCVLCSEDRLLLLFQRDHYMYTCTCSIVHVLYIMCMCTDGNTVIVLL